MSNIVSMLFMCDNYKEIIVILSILLLMLIVETIVIFVLIKDDIKKLIKKFFTKKFKICFGEWEDHLIHCPSQCYLPITIYYKGKKFDYIGYLRWRWEDPWQAYILKDEENDGFEIMENLFDFKKGEYFREEELEECKKKAKEVFVRYFEKKFAGVAELVDAWDLKSHEH